LVGLVFFWGLLLRTGRVTGVKRSELPGWQLGRPTAGHVPFLSGHHVLKRELHAETLVPYRSINDGFTFSFNRLALSVVQLPPLTRAALLLPLVFETRQVIFLLPAAAGRHQHSVEAHCTLPAVPLRLPPYCAFAANPYCQSQSHVDVARAACSCWLLARCLEGSLHRLACSSSALSLEVMLGSL